MTLTIDDLEWWDKYIDAGLAVYKMRVFVDSTDISTWDSTCAYAGKVFVEETAFGTKQAYDTTSTGTDNTVSFSFTTAPTGLDNPLTLILRKYDRKQVSAGTSPIYRVEIEGYKTS